MEPEVVSQLLALNRQFYQTQGREFSSTRLRLQPGVLRLLERIASGNRILDLGCGNAQLARQLSQMGFNREYIGLDASSAMLAEIGKTPLDLPDFSFIYADLSTPNWDEGLMGGGTAASKAGFDRILAFAVLHHLPGDDLRRQVLHKVRRLISENGYFIHSEWQFLNSPRLLKRIQPWETIGLSERQIEPGDYLLDWRRGGYSLRYVHSFTQEELSCLARETGFKIMETFLSDGENGRLGLYQVWAPV